MRKYGESKTTRIMMAIVPHVTSGLGLRKFQADGFLLTRVYQLVGCISIESAQLIHNNNTLTQYLSCYKLHWSTKFNFFLVPRTSIDELSSTFYAKFRYVHRIFLSGRVSKIQRNFKVQNSTLHAHETGRNFPLKCRGI